jgi:hypothetical protein
MVVKATTVLEVKLQYLSGRWEVINDPVATTGTSGSYVLSVSPALTGIPTAPTAAAGTNTTQIATTQYVVSASSGEIVINIGNGTSIITTGEKLTARLILPKLFSGTLTGWTLVSDTSSTTTIDIWKVPYASYPATNANSICGGFEPALSGTDKNTDSDITNWSDLTLSGDDQIGVNVDTNNNAKWILLTLTYTR